ncbi:hypothetical protein JD844_018075, partial [Phrynosoma platyrhinos]
ICIEFIKGTLNVEQACEAFQAAVAYELVDLQKYCLTFIENCTQGAAHPTDNHHLFTHIQEVVQTRGFLELSEVAMQTLLRSNCLTIDEVKLIHAVREWAHVGSVSAHYME